MKIYQMLHFPVEGVGTGIYVDNLANCLARNGLEVNRACGWRMAESGPERRTNIIDKMAISG